MMEAQYNEVTIVQMTANRTVVDSVYLTLLSSKWSQIRLLYISHNTPCSLPTCA